MKIKKKLFICEDVETSPTFFTCRSNNQFTFVPAGPDSGRYIQCTEELCPLIDESDFAVQIFKDVATVRDLTPQGTPVNLNKFHYSVTERDINDIISTDDQCYAGGFRHDNFYFKTTENSFVQYAICVNYVGDCDGTIYPGQVKTCTVENYIWTGSIRNFPTGNAIDGATTGTTTQSSNLGVPQSSNLGVPQSSNLGVPQSSNLGVPQSSNVGVPNTIVQAAEDSPTLAKIAKLKAQWLDLLP